MAQIRAQITTRSGPPGTKDTPALVQGEFRLHKGRKAPEFFHRLGEVLEAAAQVAQDGMVTEVAVLVYPDALDPRG